MADGDTGTGQEPDAGADNNGTGQASGQQQQDPWADPETARAEIEKLRSEAASWRTKLRELEPLARKAQEAEEANKSEIQKSLDRAAAAEAKIKELELAQLRIEVAQAAGLTAAQARRLSGATKEELEADAKAYAAEMGAGRKADLKQGARGGQSKPDPDSWIRQMAGR